MLDILLLPQTSKRSEVVNMNNNTCKQTVKNICSFIELQDSLYFGLFGALFSCLYLCGLLACIWFIIMLYKITVTALNKVKCCPVSPISQEQSSPPSYRQATNRNS